MLSTEQIEHFNTKGYLVVEDLVGPEVLTAIREEYAVVVDELYQKWFDEGLVDVAPESLGFWEKLDQGYLNDLDVHQPMNLCLPHGNVKLDSPMHSGPAIFDLVNQPKLLDMVEDLIGPEITVSPIQHVRIKPPERAVRKDELRAHVIATDWHQDQGVTLDEADDTTMITVWMAVTDATVENGCLQVSADGAADELLPHCLNKQVSIVGQDAFSANAIPTPVKAGGAVIFHPLTPHASLTNKSDGYRWSFDLRFNVTGQPTGRSQFPEYIARSRKDPSAVLTDWKELKEMWDETRVRLASDTYLPQHRWDIDNPYCA